MHSSVGGLDGHLSSLKSGFEIAKKQGLIDPEKPLIKRLTDSLDSLSKLIERLSLQTTAAGLLQRFLISKENFPKPSLSEIRAKDLSERISKIFPKAELQLETIAADSVFVTDLAILDRALTYLNDKLGQDLKTTVIAAKADSHPFPQIQIIFQSQDLLNSLDSSTQSFAGLAQDLLSIGAIFESEPIHNTNEVTLCLRVKNLTEPTSQP